MSVRLRSFRSYALVTSLIAAGCSVAEPAEDADYVDLGATDQALGVTCVEGSPCSGEGVVSSSSYRVGATATSRGVLLETFTANAAGTPSSLSFVARSLRAFSSPVAPQLHVEIYGPLNPASPIVEALSPIASEVVPVASLVSSTPTVVTFTDAAALEAGATYGLYFWADPVSGSGATGTVLVGIGSILTDAYAGGRTFRAGHRRLGSEWGLSRLRTVEAVDLAFALTVETGSSGGAPTPTAAYCWGDNQSGQLGDGTVDARLVPGPVTGGLTFTQLKAGGGHACGLDAAGHAWCWGANGSGELGNGTTYSPPPPCWPPFLPECQNAPPPTPTEGLAPTAVVGGHVFTQLALGSEHSCGLKADGSAWCWGQNYAGALGDGTTSGRLEPTAVAGGHTFTAISASFSHTCALDTTGAAWCWGVNSEQRLGDGTGVASRTVPTAVVGGHSFVSISAGSEQTCALESSGQAYCWGYNGPGAIGDGTTTQRGAPTAVIGGHVFTAIVTAGSRASALDTAGKIWSWGFNGNGQLGVGDTANHATPTALAGNGTFQAIALGSHHGCALDLDDRAWCWGLGEGVGDGTGAQRNSPVLVSGGLVFASLAATSSLSCGLVQ